MTFDYVLNNDTPLAFPDSIAIQDNWVFDPVTNRYYDRKVEDSENDYEYRSSQDRWVSDVDLSMRKVLDDNYVEIPGDVMTGSLQMGENFLTETDPGDPIFIARRYDLEGLDLLPSDTMTVKQPHTLRCKEYVLNERVTVDENAIVYGVKSPSYETKWYKLKKDPPYSNDTPAVIDYPIESDWDNIAPFHTGTTIILGDGGVDGDTWIRTIQTITETSSEVDPKPAPVDSICDTPMIQYQTSIPKP